VIEDEKAAKVLADKLAADKAKADAAAAEAQGPNCKAVYDKRTAFHTEEDTAITTQWAAWGTGEKFLDTTLRKTMREVDRRNHDLAEDDFQHLQKLALIVSIGKNPTPADAKDIPKPDEAKRTAFVKEFTESLETSITMYNYGQILDIATQIAESESPLIDCDKDAKVIGLLPYARMDTLPAWATQAECDTESLGLQCKLEDKRGPDADSNDGALDIRYGSGWPLDKGTCEEADACDFEGYLLLYVKTMEIDMYFPKLGGADGSNTVLVQWPIKMFINDENGASKEVYVQINKEIEMGDAVVRRKKVEKMKMKCVETSQEIMESIDRTYLEQLASLNVVGTELETYKEVIGTLLTDVMGGLDLKCDDAAFAWAADSIPGIASLYRTELCDLTKQKVDLEAHETKLKKHHD
jgi:hypothetical protein